MSRNDEQATLEFASAELWDAWLLEHEGDSTGIWLKVAKKGSGIASVKIQEALDVALCHGWIDGQRKSLDTRHYLQRYTPRRARSLWSKRNIENIARLAAAGRMTPRGIAEVERARADGRWAAAYDSHTTMTIPDDLLAALAKHPVAHEGFRRLNRTNIFAIVYRLQTATRPETRQRRLEKFVEMLERGENLF